MLNLVFVGHIDHGKSTLICRLLYDTNSLPQEKIEEVKRTCEQLGRKFEFAYILDALEEEREKQITIDTTQIFFSWDGKDYCIIDAPGHKEFIKNMLTGATQSDVAILIVSAKEGMEEQTKRHAFLLKLLGIEKIIVVVNKMDLVNYENSVFEKTKEDILSYLSSLGITPYSVIPISAIKGENVVKNSEHMPWYKGKSLIEVLSEIEKEMEIKENQEFILPIQDVYEKNGKKVYVGNIAVGEVHVGEKVRVLPSEKETKVEKILIPEETEKARAPKAIGIVLESGTFSRGEIITKNKDLKTTTIIKANIFAISNFEEGEYDFCCSTQKIPCNVKIEEKIDIDSLEAIKENKLKNGDIGRVIITLEKPCVVSNFYKIPELGKFTLEKNSEVIAGGILL